MEKSVKQVQKEADQYIGQFKSGYFSPVEQMLRMTEEIGELAREINHHYGPKKKKPGEPEKELAEELGDVFFVLVLLANTLGIELDEAFEQVMNKYQHRDAERFEKK